MWSGSWAGQAIRKIHALATRGFAYYLKEAVRQYHGQYLVRELTDATHPRPSQAHLVAGFGKKDEEFPLSDSALRAHLQKSTGSRPPVEEVTKAGRGKGGPLNLFPIRSPSRCSDDLLKTPGERLAI